MPRAISPGRGRSKSGGVNRPRAKPWWSFEGNEAGLALIDQFQWLDQEQKHHRERNLRHLRMYSNRLAATMSGASFATYDPWQDDRMRRNVVQSIVDSALAQMASNKIRPMPLTIDGDYKLQARAKKMQKYFDGAFHTMKQHEIWLQVFQAAGIFGTGIEKVYDGYDRVMAEKINTDNFVVDDVEGQGGHTLTTYEYREVNKDALMAHPFFKKHADKIADAGLLRQDHWGRHRLANPVGVVEAYRLPSYPGAKDGRKMLAISTGVLESDVWEYDTAPYAVYRWKTPEVGYYGVSLAEEVTPHQVEINFTLQKIQRVAWLTAYGQLWAKTGTVAVGSHTNDEGQISMYDGAGPPQHVPISTGIGELYQHAENTYNAAFQDTGISQLQATAQKPAGLNSGVALRTYNDTTSSRFMHAMQRAETFHTDVANLYAIAERRLEKKAGDRPSIMAKGRSGLIPLKWSEVDIDEDKLQIHTYPTSFLPAEPAGKLERLKELGEISPELQAGMIRNMDFPDTEAILARVTAPDDLADMVIELALDEQQFMSPEPQWPLERMINNIAMALPRAELNGAPEEGIQMLRDWLADAAAMVNPPAPPMPAGPSAPSMAPGAPMGLPPGPGAPPMLPPGPIDPSMLPPQ